VAAVGVGPVTRRARPFSSYGRIVGAVDELALDLGVEAGEVARVIAAVRLEAWGRNARGAPVWRARDIRALFGVQEPPRHRGAPQFRMTIPRSRGRPRSHVEPQRSREWALTVDEEG